MSLLYIPHVKKQQGSIMRLPVQPRPRPLPRPRQAGAGRRMQKGGDFWSDLDGFFRESHVLSTMTGAVVAGSIGLAGNFLAPGIGGVIGAGVGAGAGSLTRDAIYQAGYGKKKRKNKKNKKK